MPQDKLTNSIRIDAVLYAKLRRYARRQKKMIMRTVEQIIVDVLNASKKTK